MEGVGIFEVRKYSAVENLKTFESSTDVFQFTSPIYNTFFNKLHIQSKDQFIYFKVNCC